MQKLQPVPLQMIGRFVLISVLLVGTSQADASIKIYSALGSPLIAEIQLLPGELNKKTFSITGKGDPAELFEVERVADRSALLLLSVSPINRPILDLELTSADGEVGRSFTLFLDPVAANSSASYIKRLLQDRNRALELRETALSKKVEADSGRSWLTDMGQTFSLKNLHVIPKWSIFVMLGGLVALLLLRWWRAAEPVSVADQESNLPGQHNDAPCNSDHGDSSDIWQEFHHGVEQIEKSIQGPESGDGK